MTPACRPLRNLRRENHFLPVCYQRGFADAAGKVWVKEWSMMEAEYRNPERVGRKRNFYTQLVNGVEDDQIERFFGTNVETGFGLFSQRIKDEGLTLEPSGTELGFLVRFVAAQAVRTMAHKRCVEEQAGGPVDRETYLRVMTRQLKAITDAWGTNLPSFLFLTSLPYVTHRFITGDNPVVVFTSNRGVISGPPTETPVQTITQLPDILSNPESQFSIALSPYVTVMIGQPRANAAHVEFSKLDPIAVLKLNALLRDQCRSFTLARDKDSL
jgi:Protein of unknown function (DUF4238)